MDQIFKQCGAFGLYQQLNLLIVGIASALSAMTIYSTIFTANTPEFFCVSKVKNTSNNSAESIKFGMPKSCQIRSNLTLHQSHDCYLDDKYYSSLVNEWAFICDKSYLVDLTQTIYMVIEIQPTF
jgi:hypothetical protein